MRLSTSLVALVVATPSLVSAALFPKGSQVKIIDEKGFKAAMEKNETSLVAFVAPWCGHCQRMAPEYAKAALGLYPLIPAYAVNCNLDKNKPLCSREGVQGFPTIKMYPRGKTMPPVLFEQERTASGFWYFATRGIPSNTIRYSQVFEVMPWIRKTRDKHRLLLLGKEKKVPLLWRVLANKYAGQDIAFASIRDRKGRVSKEMNFEVGGEKESKVILYAKGTDEPFRYEGLLKHESLSKFIDSVLDGTADLRVINEAAKAEEFEMSEEELEIERKQEAQRIALMHGGYNDMIDFEAALKNGAGADFHDTHGYGGMMGDVPEHMKKKKPTTESIASSETMASTAAPAASSTAEVDDSDIVVGQDPEFAQVVMQAAKEEAQKADSKGGCPYASSDSSQESCSHHKDEL